MLGGATVQVRRAKPRRNGADAIEPIIGRYGQYADPLEQINTQFSEEELDTVAHYLEQTSDTF